MAAIGKTLDVILVSITIFICIDRLLLIYSTIRVSMKISMSTNYVRMSAMTLVGHMWIFSIYFSWHLMIYPHSNLAKILLYPDGCLLWDLRN